MKIGDKIRFKADKIRFKANECLLVGTIVFVDKLSKSPLDMSYLIEFKYPKFIINFFERRGLPAKEAKNLWVFNGMDKVKFTSGMHYIWLREEEVKLITDIELVIDDINKELS